MIEVYRGLPEKIHGQTIARQIIEQSIRPVLYPEAVQDAIETSLSNRTPLRARMVMCPNWVVNSEGRGIAEIPPETQADGTVNLDYQQGKIHRFLCGDVPEFVSHLNKQGLSVELLVVVADILSPAWVYDEKDAQSKLEQNLKVIKAFLTQSKAGRTMFDSQEKGRIRIESQKALTDKTPGYKEELNRYHIDGLRMGSPMNKWYLETIKQLQDMNEYADTRGDLRGLKKVWDRALFLSSSYAMDGRIFEDDFVRAKFPVHEKPQGHIALGAVSSAHGDIIAQGLNIMRGKPIGLVTPFNNAMEHSWSE